MFGRILKTLVVLLLVGVAATVAWSRWKLDGVARRVTHDALAGATSVSSGRVHARAWPPAAIVDDVTVRGAGGAEVARIKQLVLPLGPGAIVGHFRSFGAPHIEGFVVRVVLPASGPAPLAMVLAPGALPAWGDWAADGGRLEVRVGAAAPALVLTNMHAEERSGRWTASGLVEGTSRTAHFEGRWQDGKLALQSSLPLDAVSAAPVLVEAPTVVRGGAVTFEGTLSLDRQRIGFRGAVEARDLLVEGSGPATALQHRLRNGNGRAHLPLVAEIDLLHGGDWARAFREGLATGAPLE